MPQAQDTHHRGSNLLAEPVLADEGPPDLSRPMGHQLPADAGMPHECKSCSWKNANRVSWTVTEYRPRVADEAISRALTSVGGVLLEGARAVGKTTTGSHHAASSVRLDSDPDLPGLASLEPAAVLSGATPRLIDEWQLAPPLWNAVRHEIDKRGTPG